MIDDDDKENAAPSNLVDGEDAISPTKKPSRFRNSNKRTSARLKGLPSLFDLQLELSTVEEAKNYFTLKNVFRERSSCGSCNENSLTVMEKYRTREGKECKDKNQRYFRCSLCKSNVSRFEECILDKDVVRHDLNKFLLLCILVISSCINQLIVVLTGMNGRTVARCRNIITQCIIYDFESDAKNQKIGGMGVEVEVAR